jgi:cytochrome c oxidase subunit II
MSRLLVALFAGLGLASTASADWMLNFRKPVTEMAQMQYDLHVQIMWVITVIFVLVFGVMFYSLYKHRKSIGHKPAQFHESHTVEIIWTIVPFFILLAMAFPATKAILANKDTTNSDMTIKVTGYQWKWGYDYIHDGFGYLSQLKTPLAEIKNEQAKNPDYLLEVDNPMVVPAGKKVRLLITAADVIHAWYMPTFGVQQDATPGFINDAWFKVDTPGIYKGQCAKICGKEHAFMPIVVEVKSAADYSAWVKEQKAKVEAAKKPVTDAAPALAPAVTTAPVAAPAK